MTIVICTGGFDPLHSGHIAYLKAARGLGDKLIVGINSDSWLERKKGRAFMPWQERAEIMRNLSFVDHVMAYDDQDGSSKDAIVQVRRVWPTVPIVFANGGDRTVENIPEMDIEDPDIKFVFGIGGFNKNNSSSWILEEWKAPKTERPWGYYRILHQVPGMKVKELAVNSGQSLSMQRHQDRSEHWIVSSGACQVQTTTESGYNFPIVTLEKHQSYDILSRCWHQLSNPFEEPCRIVEIQYGTRCDEDDIERR